MSSNTKWLPLYVADYLGDTMHLTTLQHGAYMLLLMHYWRTGPLSSDPGQLAAIAKMDPKEFKLAWVVLQPFFTTNGDGTLHQKRMDWELRRWDEISEKRSAAGKLGGAGKRRPHPTNGSTPPPRVVHKASEPDPKPVAIARNQPVDNLASAVDNLASAKQIPSNPEANAKQMLPVSLDFASVHSHPQEDTYLLSSQEKCAREPLEPVSEQKSSPPAPDHLNDWLASIEQAEETHKASLMSKERKHTPDVQKRSVTKPRSMACPLAPDHLVLVRKQAGYGVAA